MKKVTLTLAISLLSSAAWGQCSGVFPPASVCGNPSSTTSSTPRALATPVLNSVIIQPATGPAVLTLNPLQTGQQAVVNFYASSAPKWSLIKQSGDNHFMIYDAVAGQEVVQITSNDVNSAVQVNRTLTVVPGTGTINKGINVTQTGPSGVVGPAIVPYSQFTVNDGTAPTGAFPQATAVQIQYNITAGAKGEKYGLLVGNTLTTNLPLDAGPQDQIGAAFFASSGFNRGGSGGAEAGVIFGSNPIAGLAAGATFYQMIAGEEIDVGIASGASALQRFGLQVANSDVGFGSTRDAAIGITSANSSGSFKSAISLDGQTFTGFGLATDASIIRMYSGSATIANGINLPNLTITGDIFNFGAPFRVSGAGGIFLPTGQITNWGAGALTLTGGAGTLTASSATSPTFRVLSTGAINAYIVIDTSQATLQSGFQLNDNGTGKWQFIKQAGSNAFLVFSNADGVTFQSFNPGAGISFTPVGGVSINSGTDPGQGNLLMTGHWRSKAPVTLTGTSGSAGTQDSSVIFNPSGTFTFTLPTASSNTGRWIFLKLIAAQIVNSASSNVVPIGSTTAGTAIFPATVGKYAILQSDGTNWITMNAN